MADPIYLDEIENEDTPTYMEGSVEQRALDTVVNCYNTYYEQRRSDLEETFERAYRMDRGIYEKADGEDGTERYRSHVKSKVFIKILRALKRSAHAAVMKGLFASDPFFDIDASKDITVDNDQQKAEVLKEILNNLYYRQNRKREISKFVWALATYGTGFAKITPQKHETKKIKVEPRVDKQGNVKPEIVMSKATAISPKFENIDIRNVYIDRYAENISDSKGIIIKDIIKKHQYDEKIESGEYFDVALNEREYSGSELDPKYERFRSIGASTSLGYKGIEILEYWGQFDGEEWRITVADRKYIVKMEKNPFWMKRRPFIHGRWEVDPHMLYGIGVEENGEGAQAAFNAYWRLTIDNMNLINNAMYNVDVDAIDNIETEDFEVYPGKIWKSRGGRPAVDRVAPQQFNMDMKTVQELERYMQEETGVPKILGGQQTRGDATATEIDAMMSTVSMNIAEIVAGLEWDLIVPMLQMDSEQIAQFMPEHEIINLAGAIAQDESTRVTREDVVGAYDFKALGTSAVIGQAQHNNAIINLRNAFGDQPWNWDLLGKQYMDNLNIKKSDEIAPEGGVVPVPTLEQAAQLVGMPPEAFQQLMQMASDPDLMKQTAQQQQQQEMAQQKEMEEGAAMEDIMGGGMEGLI